MATLRQTARVSTSVPMTALAAFSNIPSSVLTVGCSAGALLLIFLFRNHLQPAILHLRLVVQCGLLPGMYDLPYHSHLSSLPPTLDRGILFPQRRSCCRRGRGHGCRESSQRAADQLPQQTIGPGLRRHSWPNLPRHPAQAREEQRSLRRGRTRLLWEQHR